MTACPPLDALERLLHENTLESGQESVIAHLGQCESCRKRLYELSLEDRDDWCQWESVLESNSDIWPSDGDSISRAQVGSPASPTVAPEGLEETIPLGAAWRPGSTATSPGSPKAEFADYELLDKLGSGGMGIVYLARQTTANRVVALKIIRPEQIESLDATQRQSWLDRFRAEARSAARLEHDHVVRVYDVGEYHGTLFYSMQYIEGRSLAEIIRDHPIEGQRLARLMYGVVMAVDHAHQHGVLHRDLKPRNILIQQPGQDRAHGSTVNESVGSSVGEMSINERSYVADFGLAKNVEETSGSTMTGEAIGTPSYMSPEQARDSSRCTPASDVYSLGATIYDGLTGRPPFRAATPVETLRQVIDQPPVAPRELNPNIDLDLQTITLKALEKDPSRRYASAALLADDLRRYIEGKPIEARPIGRVERLGRWCRRNPTVAILTGGVAALLLVVAIGSTLASRRFSQQATRESLLRKEAEDYFVMSLDVIHDMLTEYGDESLAHVPRMEQVRQELLQRALALYSDLSATKPTNPDLRIELARTRHRIANLYDLLGKPDDARRAYAEAILLFENLIDESPDDNQLRYYWSNSHAMLGETLRKTSPADARFHLERAIETQRYLIRANPTNDEYQRVLSQSLNNLGLLFSETGDLAESEQDLDESIEILQKLSSNDDTPDEELAQLLADLGRTQINLGVLIRKGADRASESEHAYREAIGSLSRAIELDPTNRDYPFRLAIATLDLANYFIAEAPDPQQALALATDASEQLAALSDDFPGIPVYRYEDANALNTAAVALATQGKLDEAATHFERADQVLAELDTQIPGFSGSDARFHSLRGRVYGGLGFVRSLQGDRDQALKLVRQAIESQQTATKLHPENPQYATYLQQHRGFLQSLAEPPNSP